MATSATDLTPQGFPTLPEINTCAVELQEPVILSELSSKIKRYRRLIEPGRLVNEKSTSFTDAQH